MTQEKEKSLSETRPFWEVKQPEELSAAEWEALCDGCGLCCLVKLEDADTGELHYTSMVCELMDSTSCRCRDYENRHRSVPDCLPLTPDNIGKIEWLPPTCAYKIHAAGKPLYWWHPLVSGSRETVHEAGISLRGWTINERDADLDDVFQYIVDRPFQKE